MRVAYLFTQAGGARSTRSAWFDSQSLKRLVPDVADRVAYVCGPAGMTKAVVGSLRALGVPSDQIRTEVFRLQ